jgi:hypothetical protein
MNKKYLYFVEGDCEQQFINALKEQPSRIVSGKVKKYNVIQKMIPKSQLLSIQPGTTVVFIFDTDIKNTEILDRNIQMVKKCCGRIQLVFLMQVLQFEDEIVRGTDIKKVQDLTKSKSNSNFKTDFCRMKTADCRRLLERHHLDLGKIWITKPSKEFKKYKSEKGVAALKLQE